MQRGRNVADEAQARLLKEKGVEAWNDWREAADNNTIDFCPVDLSGTDLRDADLKEISFIGANLERTNLSGADLRGADLTGTNLKRANLSRANLSYADLRWSNLSDLNCSRATFHEADLSGANLSRTNLYGSALFSVDLTGALLQDANFSDCHMDKNLLVGIDLSLIKGLETIKHLGPSTIDIDTVYLSSGNIPEVFLRGAGVPEPFIGYMKSLIAAMSPVEFFSCFISYSHANKTFARRLHDRLQARGIRCWLDEHQLLPGDDIYHEVDRGIRLWDKMLLCCSESSLKSWWVDNEIGTALEKEQQLMKEREAKVQVLVPLNLDGYLFSDQWKSGYQAQLRRRLAADFTEIGTDIKFDEQVERLIKALRADEGAREKPPKPRL